MTYKELHDTFKKSLDKMNILEIVPTNPKVAFLIGGLMACKHEDLEELRRTVVRHHEMQKVMPAVFGMAVLFIKERMR